MAAQEMTVIEFAAKHCAEHGEGSAAAIEAHVNGIILASLTENRALWKVGIDADGRASLLWVSLPEEVWEALLSAGAQLHAMLAWFGGAR